MQKVVEFIDIAAPQQEVFQTIVHQERRAQLSPFWGLSRLVEVTPDFPSPGSQIHFRLNTDPIQDFISFVTAYQPPARFAYCLDNDRQTSVSWSFQPIASGTRLVYEEQFLDLPGEAEEFLANVRKIAREWLANIKRYEELRGTRFRRFLRWLMDRYYLRMRPDQRRTVQLILYMQAVGFISFVAAALAFGIGSLIVK